MSVSNDIAATLVASEGTQLTQALVDAAVARANVTARIVWLAQDRAADVICTGIAAQQLHAVLAEALKDQAVDILVPPAVPRRKKLLIADMESTIIQEEMLDELADFIGMREQVASITRRAMNGELDFTSALKERVGLLKGQPVKILERVAERMTYMPGAATLVATMKDSGAKTWLVSGGFLCFVKPVAAKLGFDKAFANDLVVRDGVLTGEVADPILDKNAKKAFLLQACAEYGVDLKDTVTVGDGANDVPMLAASNEGGGLGVAYHAKPNVRTAVHHQINYGDLTALLFAQGYHASAFKGA